LPEGWREDRTPAPAAPAVHQHEVVAIYNDITKTIFLPDAWTGTTAAEVSVLVHEMVHHLQNLAGLKYDCPAAREKPAYLAQDKWLQLYGLDLETEFQIDKFTLVVSSACMG
jgi:predicted metalloprotease